VFRTGTADPRLYGIEEPYLLEDAPGDWRGGLLVDIGKLAPGMCHAEGQADLPIAHVRTGAGLEQAFICAIAIHLERAVIARQLLLDGRIPAAFRIDIDHSGWCRPVPWSIIERMRPEPTDPGAFSALFLDGHPGLIAKDPVMPVDDLELSSV